MQKKMVRNPPHNKKLKRRAVTACAQLARLQGTFDCAPTTPGSINYWYATVCRTDGQRLPPKGMWVLRLMWACFSQPTPNRTHMAKQLTICRACGGTGQVKSTSNFRVFESECAGAGLRQALIRVLKCLYTHHSDSFWFWQNAAAKVG